MANVNAKGKDTAKKSGTCTIYVQTVNETRKTCKVTVQKDEIADLIEACETYEQVVAQVDDWMDYYNNDRGQWDLLKLTPKEYYEYLQTGIYPLPVYEKGTSRGSAPDPEV